MDAQINEKGEETLDAQIKEKGEETKEQILEEVLKDKESEKKPLKKVLTIKIPDKNKSLEFGMKVS